MAEFCQFRGDVGASLASVGARAGPRWSVWGDAARLSDGVDEIRQGRAEYGHKMRPPAHSAEVAPQLAELKLWQQLQSNLREQLGSRAPRHAMSKMYGDHPKLCSVRP